MRSRCQRMVDDIHGGWSPGGWANGRCLSIIARSPRQPPAHRPAQLSRARRHRASATGRDLRAAGRSTIASLALCRPTLHGLARASTRTSRRTRRYCSNSPQNTWHRAKE